MVALNFECGYRLKLNIFKNCLNWVLCQVNNGYLIDIWVNWSVLVLISLNRLSFWLEKTPADAVVPDMTTLEPKSLTRFTKCVDTVLLLKYNREKRQKLDRRCLW